MAPAKGGREMEAVREGLAYRQKLSDFFPAGFLPRWKRLTLFPTILHEIFQNFKPSREAFPRQALRGREKAAAGEGRRDFSCGGRTNVLQ